MAKRHYIFIIDFRPSENQTQGPLPSKQMLFHRAANSLSLRRAIFKPYL